MATATLHRQYLQVLAVSVLLAATVQEVANNPSHALLDISAHSKLGSEPSSLAHSAVTIQTLVKLQNQPVCLVLQDQCATKVLRNSSLAHLPKAVPQEVLELLSALVALTRVEEAVLPVQLATSVLQESPMLSNVHLEHTQL